jgi:DNA polymerase-3 subunit delta'
MIQARWNFARIPGLEAEKDLLRRNIREDRIPHSQLFLGDYGTATLGMALATARFILCEQR